MSLPTVARYQVVSTVAPSITQAVSVADRVHKTLCSFMADHAASAGIFTGKDAETNEPLSGQQHAFTFCEANGRGTRSRTSPSSLRRALTTTRAPRCGD